MNKDGIEFHPFEMYRLINLLIEAEQHFVVEEVCGFPSVRFMIGKVEIGDAVCHPYSYGHEYWRLEIMGLDITRDEYGDTVLGWLTAEEVMEHYWNAVREI